MTRLHVTMYEMTDLFEGGEQRDDSAHEYFLE